MAFALLVLVRVAYRAQSSLSGGVRIATDRSSPYHFRGSL